MRHIILHLPAILLGIAAMMSMSSCSLLYEDNDGCPNGLYVRFVYDYNTVRADLFKDHVGSVQLFIYDESDRLVATRSLSNTTTESPLSRYGYTMHFTPAELPAGHRYRLQAVAMQRDFDEARADAGARYRMVSSTPENPEGSQITLDHDITPIPGTNQYAVDPSAPLDTLWHTLKVMPHNPKDGMSVPDMDRTTAPFSVYPMTDQMVEIRPDMATYATISLIRDTKHLNLTLRQVDTPENIHAEDYEVMILDNNAIINHDNSLNTADSVRYTPYASWTSRLRADNTLEIENVITGDPGQYHAPSRSDGTLERTAHYNLMFNRMIINTEDNRDNALLEIHNKQTGKLVARLNLPYLLAQGRQAYELRNYGMQEYLDREYDYRLDFFLKGDEWIQVELHVLSWSKRIDNLKF